MNRPKHPCKKDCPRRSAECHAICEEWKAYEQERAKFYKARTENIELNRVLNDIEQARKIDIATGKMKRRKSKKPK